MNCARKGCTNPPLAEVEITFEGREASRKRYTLCPTHMQEAMEMAMQLQQITGMPAIVTYVSDGQTTHAKESEKSSDE